MLEFVNENDIFLYWSSLHAVITNLDTSFIIHPVEGAHSVEVAQGSVTLGEILGKWANRSSVWDIFVPVGAGTVLEAS